MDDVEKNRDHVELADQLPELVENDDISYAEGRKIIHKVDRRLITALGLMFAVSLMDRANLGGASIAGMSVELGLGTGTRYSICIILFFVPYVIFQWPSAILARKLGPRFLLPGVTAAWGLTQLCFGFVHSWQALAGLRVIVGVFEAALFPAALFLLQMWYCRYDVHRRYAAFYLISVLGSSLSGICSYGFMQMGGVGGYLGWRYIFIWEGVLTIIIAIIGAILIVDFPQDAMNSRNFLKPNELAYIIRLLERDRKDAAREDDFSWAAFFRGGLDLKIWLFGLIFFANTVISYSIAFFLPIILNRKMGFGVGISQVLSTPPYFFAAFYMFMQGWLGDRYHVRGLLITFNSLVAICGLCLLAWTTSAASQYFGIFIVTGVSNSSIPCVMAWQANNIRGQWKRAFSSASLITLGGLGGIVGALVFRSQDAPQYLPGIYASLSCCALTLLIVLGLSIYFTVMNKKVDREEVIAEGLSGFHYTL